MILVISNTKANGTPYTNALRYFGLVAFQETPARALSEISPRISAVLIATPEAIADESDFVKRIKAYDKSVPVFAIKDAPCEAYDGCIPKAHSASLAYESMQKYINSMGLRPLGTYKLAGLDVSAGLKPQSYSFLDIKFTDTESFIIRYLIRSFPVRQTARDIIKYAYPRGTMSCEAVIRTHIAKINKKFSNLTGRRLITSEVGEGYIIDTPMKPEIYRSR
ncbi:MAG: hypothetical protein IJW66_00405 [Clostridia bacterium]|nr:hypothetical protein [Clostridia bacterium]